MANIYKAGGDVAGALAKLATKLFQEGKTSNEIRETLAEKVPGATSADIEKAVTPTLQSKVERGKELMVVEPGVARPARPEPSTETALVPTGRPAKTTFIAGPEGVSAGEKATPQPRTIEERIKKAKQPEEIALPATAPGLTKTQKAGAGLATAGAAGMVKGALTPEDEDKSVPGARLTPKITGETYKDIKFEPSVAEVQAAVDKGGMETTRALWDRYDKLNAEFQKTVTEGGMEYADPKKAAAVFLQSKQPFTGPPRGAAGKLAVEEKVSAETEKMAEGAPDMTKEKQDMPAPPSGGIVSEPRSVQVKPTAAKPQSQREIALGAELDINQFQNKLASGQPISRGDLLAITNKMEELKPNEVTADQSLIQKIEAAKEEARKAYQQEADRNQWAEVAQTLGNAVATFIAARQGVADRPLTLPQIDYGSRTAQALRAYQTELASVGEQARAVERETERKQAAEDKRVALQQRQYERLLALGEKDIEARERKAERAQDLATRIQLAQIKDAQDKQAAAAKASKEEAAARRKGGETLASWLKSDIDNTNDQIKVLQKQVETANKVALSKTEKDLAKEMPAYLTMSGLSEDDPQFQKKNWLGNLKQDPEAIRASAKATAARVQAEIANLRAKAKSGNDELRGLLPVILGQGKAAAPAEQPARQEPAGGGMVQVELNGQPGTIPADQLEAFKKKYPNAVIKQ